MKQTAVEWLIDWMGKNQYFIGNDLLQAFEQAKVSVNEDAIKLEKEQLLDAYRKGFSEGVCFGASPTGYNHISADEYFNKTFKKSWR